MSRTLQYTLPEHLAARQTARRREWNVQLVALAIAAACIAAAGMLARPINEIRREHQLVIDPTSLATLPPDIALLGKLGTFRALAIDWASIRAERLKEEGKTYEALQLHKTICALAPQYPKLWVYAAWNMAYNISVSQYTPEARWQWVQNGIKILRDEGLKYNPNSVTLFKELTWIYWHKIGDFLDDEHLNYKRALAVEMERVLGPPPVALSDKEYHDWFRKIVVAPRDLDRFLADDAEAADLVTRLRDVQLGPDTGLLDFVARNIRPELRPEELQKNAPTHDAQTNRRLEIIRSPKNAESLDRLLAAVRSDALRNRYKLDLDWMMDLMLKQYGPLDWRNAFAHALYWSSLGDNVTEGVERTDPADSMNNARFVLFSLQQLITRGRMTLIPNFDDPFKSYIELTPDLRFIPYTFETYMRLGKKQFGDDPRYVEGTPGPQFMNGFVTALHNWIQLLYLDGGQRNIEQAENLYAWLRGNNPHPDGGTQEQYLVTLDEFVMGQLRSSMDTFKAGSAIINSFLRQALKQWSLGLMDQAMRSVALARQCYDYWMKDTDIDFNDRRKMQPIRVMLRDQIESYMQSLEIDPLAKARLWKVLPLEQRQLSYDMIRPFLVRMCEALNPPWDMNKAFPEPPGMEEFRKTDIDYRSPDRPKDVDQGERYRK
ncbi:MAG: hypothetical protein AAB341_01440 [Planctomycetota bacterium]